MKLRDLKDKDINYDWKTIYVGLNDCFFEPNILSDYAVELMEKGIEDEFIIELAWGIAESDLPEKLIDIKNKFFSDVGENSIEYVHEQKKFRYVYLSKLNERVFDDVELLNLVTKFYDENGYPDDMISFINYMPQGKTTTKDELINRFRVFLDDEKKKVEAY
ncbi:DUF2247 family protein [Vagococcus silagei]|uniref:DUF2247 family protein n=1 Tax=Vagococcus silagei TaxID=2508885 RepID=A0A4V3TVA0_9ENTE|nr:DUF2247 family protein [Vagococcus silagei]THB62079.1 DUF2247 family protein [Vagococcus silagei]